MIRYENISGYFNISIGLRKSRKKIGFRLIGGNCREEIFSEDSKIISGATRILERKRSLISLIKASSWRGEAIRRVIESVSSSLVETSMI